MFDMRPDGSAALVRCDIALEGNDSRNGLDRGEIDTNDDTLVRHAFCRHLTPTLEALLELDPPKDETEEILDLGTYTRRSTQID
jgi:2-methylcitrate dehydratase PrpD